MTLKERILSWFKKEDDKCCQDYVEFETVFDDGLLVDKDAILGVKTVPNLEDLVHEFETQFAPKKAIWRDKETKAFIKWKEDNNY